ncbi:MAG: hypothetical protein DRN15_06115 [Thermoprotei archaeon]|nr:MAG: hypothetical protein DRN15_06115 [Thermoprotei archaeon]RLF25302.1 MAG: hypothetical protein DRM97_02295 [Thermoprotei archaeon]
MIKGILKTSLRRLMALRVAAADSGCAILDGFYRPIKLVTTVAVVVSPPYTKADHVKYKYVEKRAEDPSVIVEELRLIREVASITKVDVIHIDITLRGLDLTTLTPDDIDLLNISSRAKDHLRTVLMLISADLKMIKEEIGVPVLALGKESTPVRLAELYTAVYSVAYAIKRSLKIGSTTLLGLPRAISIDIREGTIIARSLKPGEHDMLAKFRLEDPSILRKIMWREYPNPVATGFRVVEMRPIA